MKSTIEPEYLKKVYLDTETTSNKEQYISYHPVVNPKKPRRVRIVCDCAATAEGKLLKSLKTGGKAETARGVKMLCAA